MNFFMILFLKTIQYIESFKLWGFLHKIKKNGEEVNKSKNKLKKKQQQKTAKVLNMLQHLH